MRATGASFGTARSSRARRASSHVPAASARGTQVPVAMPGIFFLSGETALDEDNEEEATNNLNAINKLYPSLPWSASFSFGKASQKTAIVTWMGDTANNGAAQQALLARAKANHDACQGQYAKGTCASVGVDGNIMQAAGAY